MTEILLVVVVMEGYWYSPEVADTCTAFTSQIPPKSYPSQTGGRGWGGEVGCDVDSNPVQWSV